MPYVSRDESGNILRASMRPLVGGEVLAHHHPEIVAFLISKQMDPQIVKETAAYLDETDIEMGRALEDIITLLLRKNIFKMSELPRLVQDRMALRSKLRTKLEETYERASRD